MSRIFSYLPFSNPFKLRSNIPPSTTSTAPPIMRSILPTPRQLQRDPGLFESRHKHIQAQRLNPKWQRRDTPQASLYRIYEAFCANDESSVMQETEYFWKHSEREWRTFNLRDPRDQNRETYAMLASLVEELVDAFNWRLSLGLRRGLPMLERENENDIIQFVPEVVPAWTNNVPAMKETFVVHEHGDGSHFRKRNILAGKRYLRTI